MRFPRLAALIVPVVAAVALAAAPSVRKDPHGIYAIIDSAVVESASGESERIQLWGAFALANVVGVKDGKVDYLQLGHFHPPKRGFMYYTVNPRDEAATRSDWAQLRAAAGTGRLVAWGAHLPPLGTSVTPKLDTTVARLIMTYNGRIRSLGEPLASPDVFPQRMPGVETMRPRFRGPVELGFAAPDTGRAGGVVPPG